MRSDIDPDLFLSEIFQLRDERSDLSEVVSDKQLTSVIFDALPDEMYSTVKVQSIKDHELGFEETVSVTKIYLLIILSGHQFLKGVKSLTGKFGVAVKSQKRVIMCVNSL